MKVLHIPFQYVIGQLGGTEIYVESLCRNLAHLGVECAIAVPAECLGVVRTKVDNLEVFEFGQDPASGFEHAYGQPDQVAAMNFRKVLAAWQPDVVHLHARTAAVSEALVDEAKLAGARVVFTYHTPTVSCPRGTVMFMGREPCDGALNLSRCTACVLQKNGVKAALLPWVSRAPLWLGTFLARQRLQGGVWTALRMRRLLADGEQRFQALMTKADRIVAVCDWVAEVLRRNGVQEPKLVVSRQGLPYAVDSCPTLRTSAAPIRPASGRVAQHLRIRYFGRLDPTKGVDVLVHALATIPAADVTLEIFAIVQAGGARYQQHLQALIARDKRITVHQPLPASQIVAAMRDCDLVAVPSQGLETGPLVVLEAFAAGTPVIGSRLGGIAELVTDGVDGVLVAPADVAAWANAIGDLAASADRVRTLRAGVKTPRQMTVVAQEMWKVYENA
jgi:glycosyltransferase involved in cell wall biosynthesis